MARFPIQYHWFPFLVCQLVACSSVILLCFVVDHDMIKESRIEKREMTSMLSAGCVVSALTRSDEKCFVQTTSDANNMRRGRVLLGAAGSACQTTNCTRYEMQLQFTTSSGDSVTATTTMPPQDADCKQCGVHCYTEWDIDQVYTGQFAMNATWQCRYLESDPAGTMILEEGNYDVSRLWYLRICMFYVHELVCERGCLHSTNVSACVALSCCMHQPLPWLAASYESAACRGVIWIGCIICCMGGPTIVLFLMGCPMAMATCGDDCIPKRPPKREAPPTPAPADVWNRAGTHVELE